jgi:hypothetical protein
MTKSLEPYLRDHVDVLLDSEGKIPQRAESAIILASKMPEHPDVIYSLVEVSHEHFMDKAQSLCAAPQFQGLHAVPHNELMEHLEGLHTDFRATAINGLRARNPVSFTSLDHHLKHDEDTQIVIAVLKALLARRELAHAASSISVELGDLRARYPNDVKITGRDAVFPHEVDAASEFNQMLRYARRLQMRHGMLMNLAQRTAFPLKDMNRLARRKII